MFDRFRNMKMHRTLVICGVIVLAAYVFGSLGADISCGTDELVREAMREATVEGEGSEVAQATVAPTALPTRTPISNARWALLETARELGSVRSFEFRSTLTGSPVVNDGVAVRSSGSVVRLSSGSEDNPAGYVRMVGERTYLSRAPEAPGEELSFREISGLSALVGLVHIEPGRLLTSFDEMVVRVDSEIIMSGGGRTWLLSGLVEPEFMRSMGFSWKRRGDTDYPMQYIIAVDSETFLPDSITFVPFSGAGELKLEMGPYDTDGARPAIPAVFSELDGPGTESLVASILAVIERTKAAEAVSVPAQDSASAAAPLAQEPSVGLVQGDGPLMAVPPSSGAPDGGTGNTAQWVSAPGSRAGWRSISAPALGLALDLPETWRVARSNGLTLLDIEGEPLGTGAPDLIAGAVGSVSISLDSPRWTWVGWDTLAGTDASAAFVVMFEVESAGADMMETAAVYREDVLGLNPTLDDVPAFSTFISEAGAVCALARYVAVLVPDSLYDVADCLFATGDGQYAAVIVGAPSDSLWMPVMSSVR